MTHPLNKHFTYLVGPIDQCPNGGVSWRQEVTPFLHGLGIGVFDPTNKPLGKSEGKDFANKVQLMKNDGSFSRVKQTMRPVIKDDLHMVDLSNFITMYVDPNIHMCGSYMELAYAALEKKPICIICPSGINMIPNSVWGLCKNAEAFGSITDYKNFISDGVFGQHWRLINYNKVFGITT